VVTYDAVIDVDNSALKLKPGMTANVTFVYAEKDDVLKVPNAALRFKLVDAKTDGVTPHAPPRRHDDKAPDRRTVWVLRGEKPVMVPIKTGVSDGSVTEIVEGDLSQGDAVITDSLGDGKSGGAPRNSGFRGF